MSIPNAPFGLLGNAPMQTELVDNRRSVTPPWGGWLNFLRQWLFYNIPTIANAGGVYVSSDPIANGAFGDGIHDDTAIVQQTINSTGGILYLRPGKTFLLSSTLTAPVGFVVIYGGGIITSSANPVLKISGNSNFLVSNIQFNGTTSSSTILSLSSVAFAQQYVHQCYFTCTSGIGISSTSGGVSLQIHNCFFQATLTNAIALTSQTDVLITGCEFSVTTPVTTSGTCTYNVVGCNVAPHFGAPVLNQYAEFGGTTQTITAGAGFTAVTSCSFTVSATGTWNISANAFVQQAAAAANSATIRITRNGIAILRQAASGSPATGEFMLHIDFQTALTTGDAMVLQCSAVGSNVTLLGTGNNGNTNISGAFLTT